MEASAGRLLQGNATSLGLEVQVALRQIAAACSSLTEVEPEALLVAFEPAQGAAQLLGACRALRPPAVATLPPPEGPVQESLDELLWLVSPSAFGFPWLQGLCFFFAVLVAVVLWEVFFLKTTFLKADQALPSLKNAERLFRAAAASGFQQSLRSFAGDSSDEDGGTVAPTPAPVNPPQGAAQAKGFWERIKEAGVGAQANSPVAGGQQRPDVINFTRRKFVASAKEGRAVVTIARTGPCTGSVSVSVRTLERSFPGYKAEARKHFEPVEKTISFLPGEHEKSLEIPLHQPGTAWSPTLWFAVQLVEVLSGNAVFGSTMVMHWRQKRANECLFARVYVTQDLRFPANIPSDPEKLHSSFHLIWFYVKDRINDRGSKFWKTLLGLLYDPVHNVVVATVVQKELVHWACNWQWYGEGCYWRVLVLVFAQLLSTFLLSWGDRVQTRNRGRTGGVRVRHRQQLMAKLLMVEHAQLCRAPGSKWLYTALQTVESVTMDAYWQSLLLAQSILGLLFSMALPLIFFTGEYAGKSFNLPFVFLFGMLLTLPPTVVSLARRRNQTWEVLVQRMDAEEVCTHTLAWVAQAQQNLYSLGPRERAWLEQRFSQECKLFVTKHQIARDVVNDNSWVNRWLTSLFFCTVLYLGACNLIHSQKHQEAFANVNLVLLLQVSWSFQKYMRKVSGCITKMQRAAIAILHVKELLDLEEMHSTDASHGVLVDCEAEAIELRGVAYPRVLEMVPSAVASIPLNKVVLVHGANERGLCTFLAMAAQVLYPSEGTVVSPPSCWAVMLPPQPVGTPDCSVLEALQIAMMPEEVAKSLAGALGLQPEQATRELVPADAQALALVRALLRDPTVLVLMRPLALLGPEQKQRFRWLLRAWQAGGASGLVNCLLGLQPTAEGRSRTLVVTAEDLEPEAPRGDVRLDLSALLRACPPLLGPLPGESSSSEDDEEGTSELPLMTGLCVV